MQRFKQNVKIRSKEFQEIAEETILKRKFNNTLEGQVLLAMGADHAKTKEDEEDLSDVDLSDEEEKALQFKKNKGKKVFKRFPIPVKSPAKDSQQLPSIQETAEEEFGYGHIGSMANYDDLTGSTVEFLTGV